MELARQVVWGVGIMGQLAQREKDGGDRYIYVKVTRDEILEMQAAAKAKGVEELESLVRPLADQFERELLDAVVFFPGFPPETN